ncbi:MAG: thioredoxin domain-containing protein [Patescibacteria group bacterium]
MTKEAKIISGVGVIFFALFAFLIYRTNTGTSVVADPNLLIGQVSYMTGKKEAKVNVVEFGDYQCPACAYANSIVQQLIETYKNNPNVNFVFRNFPLPQHSNAMVSAEAAEAAGAQGKFLEMSDMLYERQNEWSGSSKALEIFAKYAQELKLDVKAFTDSVSKNEFKDAINKDRSDGQALGVNSTPSFFINGEKVVGLPSFEEFKKKIDGKLQ